METILLLLYNLKVEESGLFFVKCKVLAKTVETKILNTIFGVKQGQHIKREAVLKGLTGEISHILCPF